VTFQGWADPYWSVQASSAPGRVVVGADPDLGEPGETRDLYTGAWVDEAPDPVSSADEGPLAPIQYGGEIGYAGGPAVAEGWFDTVVLLTGGPRTFLYDPSYEAWRELDPDCTSDPGSWFTADGQVWRAWFEDTWVLRWAPALE
jgi:hypothetical protein